jgi:dihydroorotase
MRKLKANVDGHLFEFKGTPVAAIIAGQIKMREGKIIGDPTGKPMLF